MLLTRRDDEKKSPRRPYMNRLLSSLSSDRIVKGHVVMSYI